MSIFSLTKDNHIHAAVTVEIPHIDPAHMVETAKQNGHALTVPAATKLAEQQNAILRYIAASEAADTVQKSAKEAAYMLLCGIKTRAQGLEIQEEFKRLKAQRYATQNPNGTKKDAQTATNTAWSRAVSWANEHAKNLDGVEWEFPDLRDPSPEAVARREKRAAEAEQKRAAKADEAARKRVVENGAYVFDHDPTAGTVQVNAACAAVAKYFSQSEAKTEHLVRFWADYQANEEKRAAEAEAAKAADEANTFDVQGTIIDEQKQLPAPAKKATRKRKAA